MPVTFVDEEPKPQRRAPDYASPKVDLWASGQESAGNVTFVDEEPRARTGAGPQGKYGRRDSVNDRVRSINQGALFGWGDELQAFMAAGEQRGRNLTNRLLGKPITTTADQVYQNVLRREREAQGEFAQEHPVQNVALNVVGGAMAPGAGAAGAYVGGARSLIGGTARSAVVGTAAGALAGAGGAQEGERVGGAVRGAAVGGATGAAMPGLFRAGESAMRAVNAATGHRLSGGVEGAAMGRLRQALEADGVDEQTIRRTIEEWNRVGAMPPSLADVAGENTRALLRTAGARPGEARNLAQTYRNETVEAVPDASIGRARQLTPGEARPAGQFADDLTRERAVVADDMYPRFRDVGVPIGDDIRSALSGESGSAALAYARRIADARRDFRATQEIEDLISGESDQISAGTLDLIRRGLSDSAGQASRAGDNTVAGGLGARQGDLETALLDVPGFNAARNVYAHYSRRIEAVDAGARLLKEAPDDFTAVLAQMDDEAIQAAQVGARQALADALGQRANASGVLRQIAFAPNARRNLEALFGPDEAERFIQAARLNLQKAQNANFIAPNTGSQTQNKQQDANIVGSVVNAFRQPVQTILDRLANGLTLTDAEARILIQNGINPANPALARQPTNPLLRGSPNSAGRAATVVPNVLAQ